MKFQEDEKRLLVSFESAKGFHALNSVGKDSQELSQNDTISDTKYYFALIDQLRHLISLSEDKNIVVDDKNASQLDLFLCGIRALRLFVQSNFVGPPVNLEITSKEFLDNLDAALRSKLILDGEAVLDNVVNPGLVLVAKELLRKVTAEDYPSVTWWQMRADFMHERILEEKSNILWTRIRGNDEEFRKLLLSDQENNSLGALYCCELAQMHLFHYDVTTAKNLVSYAATLIGVDVSLVGALGKRTRYQQNELAQLIVKVKAVDTKCSRGENYSTPLGTVSKEIPLNDESRLERVQLTEDPEREVLSSLQQIILLNFFFVRKTFLGSDDVNIYESQAFLDALLADPKIWAIQFVSLLQRSLLEKGKTKTVSRAMEQLELLKRDLSSEQPAAGQRLYYFFNSYMPLRSKVDAALAEVYSSIGSIKSALDIYLQLGMWEEAIQCYHVLQLRNKAEEIIRKELQKGESVKLWCLLGDATDQPEYYEKAWLLSECKSARTQRQWGYYHYFRKQYAEAVPHLELSVSLNPLEYPVWMRLAYSAMQVENWELCAKAYRHACILDSDNFESWNNLANCYLKMGDKPRALKVLLEATKCDYNVWQVWDNLLVVATDCRNFDEAIKAYSRLLDLKGKHVDTEVLEIITGFICQNKEDCKGVGSIKYLKPTLKLFGRITSSVTTNGMLWKLYSDLLATEEEVTDGKNKEDILHRSVDCAQKAVRCVMQDPKWDKFNDSIKTAVEFSLNLGQRTSEFIQKYPDSPSVSSFKTTAVFTVNRLLAVLKKKKSELIEDVGVYDKYIEDLEKVATDLKRSS